MLVYYPPTILPSDAMPVVGTTRVNVCSQSSDAEISVRERQLVFENTVFSVYADHVADKSGHEVQRYLSVVPKCLLDGSIAGVAVLPVCEGKVGLVRVFRHPLRQWSWEAIKGHIEPSENVRTAAIRELQEEGGFRAASEDLVDLGIVAPEAGVIVGRTHLFATVLSEKTRGAVDGELGHGDMAFFDQAEINDLIAQGEIEDASTLVILFKHLFNQAK